ncbi:MAG: hypothetical protein L3J63_10130, partial [Geopsychrobacter sp.]|nr:hypothetical protein [Geopsychrobacter sp.]
MPRRRLLETLQAQDGARKKLIFIVARAGQGKTTFARQLLDGFADPLSWYQVSARDRDPVAFISSFVSSLCSVHNISLPILQKLIECGEVTAAEPRRFAKLLADELGSAFKGPLRLSFDDIHQIEESPSSLLFLRAFIEASALRFRFVLLSRRELLPDLIPQSRVLIDNEGLALSRTEVAELCTTFLGVSVSSKMVDQIYRLTEGWVMGILLALQSFVGRTLQLANQQLDKLEGKGQAGLLDYFQAEVLERFSADLRQTLIHLSLLESIPSELAEILSTVPHIRQTLDRLSAQNLFVRQLDGKGDTFVFHHLFQETLRAVARVEMRSEERQKIFSQAAEWFSGQDRLVEALDCYLQAQDYSRAESIVQQYGLELVASNRILTLKRILVRLPEVNIRSNAWLSFYCGVIELQNNPPKAYASLDRARICFVAQDDLVGEFLATTQLIFFHCLVDGLFAQAGSLLSRAEIVDAELADSLGGVARFHAVTILSIGFSYVNADFSKSNYYSNLALKLAEKLGQESFVFSVHLAQIYQYGFRGDRFRLRQLAEKLTSLSGSPAISSLNRAICSITTTNLLEMEGDFDNYAEQRDVIISAGSGGLAEKTTFRPFLLVWDADMAIARGDFAQASLAIREGLESDGSATTPHLRSQYLHYQAYLFALHGEKDAAVLAAQESLQLREYAGGRYFLTLNQLLLGATYVQLGLCKDAESLLGSAIESFAEMQNEFDLAAAHAHRAYLRLNIGEETAALKDICLMLQYLKKNSYVHFFSWTPSLMEKLLSVAVSHNIETEYAQMLARERLGKALLADGTLLPLLRIRTLGALALEVAGGGKINNSQLTPGKGELVALMIAGPDQRLTL